MNITPSKNNVLCKLKNSVFYLFVLFLLISPTVTQAASRIKHSQKLSVLLNLAILVLLLKFGILAFALLLAILKPQLIINTGKVLNKSTLKSCIIGVLACVFYILLMKILQFIPSPINKPLYLIIFTIIMAHFIFGFSVVCHSVGEKIQANINSILIGSTFAAVLYGGVVLLLLDFMPLLGQIVSAIIFLASLGTAFSAFKIKPA